VLDVAHSTIGSGIAFAILFGVVGLSFAYVGGNPVEPPKRGWIGIDGVNVTPAIAQALGLQEARGILVTNVFPGSPADKAGLRVGTQGVEVNGRMLPAKADVIIAIDGARADNDAEAQAALAGKHIGDSVRFTIIRDGATRDVNIVIEERPPGVGG